MFILLITSAFAQDSAPEATTIPISDSSDALMGRPASGLDPAQCGILMAGHPSARLLPSLIDAQGRSVVSCVDAQGRLVMLEANARATELRATAEATVAIEDAKNRAAVEPVLADAMRTSLMVGAPAFVDTERGIYSTGTAAPVAASARVVDAWAQRPATPVGYGGYYQGYSEARVNAAIVDLVAGNAAQSAEISGSNPGAAYDAAVSAALERASR